MVLLIEREGRETALIKDQEDLNIVMDATQTNGVMRFELQPFDYSGISSRLLSRLERNCELSGIENDNRYSESYANFALGEISKELGDNRGQVTRDTFSQDDPASQAVTFFFGEPMFDYSRSGLYYAITGFIRELKDYRKYREIPLQINGHELSIDQIDRLITIEDDLYRGPRNDTLESHKQGIISVGDSNIASFVESLEGSDVSGIDIIVKVMASTQQDCSLVNAKCIALGQTNLSEYLSGISNKLNQDILDKYRALVNKYKMTFLDSQSYDEKNKYRPIKPSERFIENEGLTNDDIAVMNNIFVELFPLIRKDVYELAKKIQQRIREQQRGEEENYTLGIYPEVTYTAYGDFDPKTRKETFFNILETPGELQSFKDGLRSRAAELRRLLPVQVNFVIEGGAKYGLEELSNLA